MTHWASRAVRGSLATLALLMWFVAPAGADDDPSPASDSSAQTSSDDAAQPPAESPDEADASSGEADQEGDSKDGDSKDGEHEDGEHEDGEHEDGEHEDGEHEDGEHEENPYDLSHSNALPTQDDASEWKFDLAIYTFIVFVLLMGILVKFAWGPIIGALQQRESRVAQMIDNAERSAAKAQQQLASYEAKLAEAHTEAEEIVNRAKQSAGEQAEQILAAAREASEREKNSALGEIEQAKNEALGEVTQRSVDIAMGLARNIVAREINASDHDAMIKDALEKFPS